MFCRSICLLVVAAGSVPSNAPARTDAERFSPGTQIKLWLAHDDPITPGLAGEQAYRNFLRTSKAKSLPALLKLSGVLVGLKNGRTVEVVAYHAMKDFFIKAPAVEARVIEDGDSSRGSVFWIAAQYLREPGASLLPGEFPLPALGYARDGNYVAKPGDEIEIYSKVTDSAFVTNGIFGFESFVKFYMADDKEGLEQLVKEGKLSAARVGTKLRVIDRHENRFIGKGNAAIEGRILDGHLKDQSVWVAEVFTARYIIVVAKDRISRPNATTEAKESKAASLLRMGQGLERSKKSAAALGYYRQVVRDFPDSDEARTAAGRIGALGGK
jgi:hypothetical protein